jgi:outer membrane lipoprotein-sorting protein
MEQEMKRLLTIALLVLTLAGCAQVAAEIIKAIIEAEQCPLI